MRSCPTIRRPVLVALILTGALWSGGATAADAEGTKVAGARPFTFVCAGAGPCSAQAGPGPADRQVHPFTGSLGRPCAYRWRATPSGTRKVRVCF